MEIEVNGVLYKKEQKSKANMSRMGVRLIMMATMFSGLYGSKTKATPNVDIIEEFGLIQLKKSELSSNERKWVVREFNKHFKKI